MLRLDVHGSITATTVKPARIRGNAAQRGATDPW